MDPKQDPNERMAFFTAIFAAEVLITFVCKDAAGDTFRIGPKLWLVFIRIAPLAYAIGAMMIGKQNRVLSGLVACMGIVVGFVLHVLLL